MSKVSFLSLPRWHSIFLVRARDGKSSVCGTMIGSVVISIMESVRCNHRHISIHLRSIRYGEVLNPSIRAAKFINRMGFHRDRFQTSPSAANAIDFVAKILNHSGAEPGIVLLNFKIPRRRKASVFADLRSNLKFNLARYFRLISDFLRWRERIEARA
mgnify:FL=1